MARSSGGDARPDQLNMVGEGTVFEGTLRAESNVRVSGHIKGTLDVDGRVIVTQEGVVEGELRATDADVAGSVQGEIHITERLMLKSTARIDGSIAAGRIKVEEGALFAGQCKIGEQVGEKVQKRLDEKESHGNGSSSEASSGAGSSSPVSSPSTENTEPSGPSESASETAVPDGRRETGEASQSTPERTPEKNASSKSTPS
jgi:cytoskeletal protein CcmA (bactofilin family)